jgi:hypothetical protein
MWEAVLNAKITGVFFTKEETWGTPQTGDWTHLSGSPPRQILHTSPLKSAFETMAEKKEDYGMLIRGITEYSVDIVKQALRILESDALYRSEKALAVAKWLVEVHRFLDCSDNDRDVRNNRLWYVVATAPTGFCHIRSTIISTLLDDLQAGMAIEAIQRRWAEKLHPLQYQRPTAAPSEGQLAQANTIVQKLESEGALARRFAKLEDVLFRYWSPRDLPEAKKKAGSGPFDHLRAKDPSDRELTLPTTVMTWVKFQRDVLPKALRIDYFASRVNNNYMAFVTSVNPEAPCLLQWDNHVSWYVYHGGSSPAQWRLTAGQWCPVTAVTCLPPHWTDQTANAHQGQAVVLLLDGARATRKGTGWFPEQLRNEYHGIRRAMEFYAKEAEVVGADEGTANGLKLEKAGQWHDIQLRVTTEDGPALYMLDRWE